MFVNRNRIYMFRKIVKTADYNCAYVTSYIVLIIFPVIIQTVTNLIMLSTGGQETKLINASNLNF